MQARSLELLSQISKKKIKKAKIKATMKVVKMAKSLMTVCLQLLVSLCLRCLLCCIDLLSSFPLSLPVITSRSVTGLQTKKRWTENQTGKVSINETSNHRATVSVGAKDGSDPQESGDLERQGQLQQKKNEKKNNLRSLVWFYLLVGVSILVVDGSKQSSSRCVSGQSGIDVTNAVDSIDLACGLNSDVVIDKGSDSVNFLLCMVDLHFVDYTGHHSRTYLTENDVKP